MKIIIVEDDKSIADILSKNYTEHAQEVFNRGDDFLNYLTTTKDKSRVPDLVILDWMLPQVSGIDLCKKIRENKNWEKVPILMLTAKSDPIDIVNGLEAGADDYVTKPFDLAILNARSNALIRRNLKSSESTLITFSNLKLDTVNRESWINDETIHLTPSEFNILLSLIKNNGNVLTRKQLVTNLTGEGIFVTDRIIDTHVFSLRKKLKNGNFTLETIRSVGYRLCQ